VSRRQACSRRRLGGVPQPNRDELNPADRLSEVTRLLAEGARRLLEQQRRDKADQAAPAKTEASSRS
jgi:hypothetical protein